MKIVCGKLGFDLEGTWELVYDDKPSVMWFKPDGEDSIVIGGTPMTLYAAQIDEDLENQFLTDDDIDTALGWLRTYDKGIWEEEINGHRYVLFMVPWGK